MKLKRIISLILAVILSLAVLTSCSVDWSEYFPFEITLDKEDDDFALRVHYLDVGQGDSILIELPNDETMLIDAGENYHGEGIINYITDLGYSKIDYLIATHPHSDHIGSMPYIVRNFDIGAVYMPKVSANTKIHESLLTAISNKNLKVKTGKAGVNIIDEDDLSVDIIAPVTISESNLNNCSIIIKLIYGDTSFLFTGDAEKAELSEVTADMSADVLKVGHHGSNTSTTKSFVEQVAPQIAVISCGKNNDYGHPHETTLEYLEDFGCEIYRTDEQQTIKVMSDGEDIVTETGLSSIPKAK